MAGKVAALATKSGYDFIAAELLELGTARYFPMRNRIRYRTALGNCVDRPSFKNKQIKAVSLEQEVGGIFNGKGKRIRFHSGGATGIGVTANSSTATDSVQSLSDTETETLSVGRVNPVYCTI